MCTSKSEKCWNNADCFIFVQFIFILFYTLMPNGCVIAYLLHIFSLILFEVDYFKTDFQHLSSTKYCLSAKWFLDNRPKSEPFVYLVIWNVQILSEILNFSVDAVRGVSYSVTWSTADRNPTLGKSSDVLKLAHVLAQERQLCVYFPNAHSLLALHFMEAFTIISQKLINAKDEGFFWYILLEYKHFKWF